MEVPLQANNMGVVPMENHDRESSNMHEPSSGMSKEGDGSRSLEPLAIIGLSARFPGDAISPEAFWDMLSHGRTAHSKIPESRFHCKAFYHPNSERSDTVSLSCLEFYSHRRIDGYSTH